MHIVLQMSKCAKEPCLIQVPYAMTGRGNLGKLRPQPQLSLLLLGQTAPGRVTEALNLRGPELISAHVTTESGVLPASTTGQIREQTLRR